MAVVASSGVAKLFARGAAPAWIVATLVVEYVWAIAAAWPFSTDDAFITLRYAQHWADGDGIRWNVGEAVPVEGYSNFLFVVLGAAAIHVGLEPLTVLKAVSCAALGGSALLLHRIARPHAGELCAMIPAVLLLGYPFTAWWTVSGLETALYLFFVVAAVYAFLRGVAGPRHVHDVELAVRGGSHHWLRLAGLLVFAAAVTRPEGPIFAIAMMLTIAIAAAPAIVAASPTQRWRLLSAHARSASELAKGLAIPLAIYFAWRLGHFGELLPNSVRCKADTRGNPWELIAWFVPLALVPLVLAAPAWRQWRRTPVLVCLLVAVLYCVILYGVDPTIAYGNRHFLAAYALLGVPAAIGARTLARHFSSGSTGARVVVPLQAVIAAVWLGFGAPQRLAREAQEYRARHEARESVARHLADRIAPGETIAIGDVGVIGHALPNVDLLDLYCLNNPAMTRPPLRDSAAALAEHVLAVAPAAIVVSSRSAQTCVPRAKVFRLLVADPGFSAYVRTGVFGAEGDEFQYWVYERAPSVGDAVF